MNKTSIDRTEAIAPILRGLEAQHPDWKDISLRILGYLGLEELGYALVERKQDWESIAESLMPTLKEDAAYVRCQFLLRCLSDEARDLDYLEQHSGLARNTISGMIAALSRGGYDIPFQHFSDREGRPRKEFYKRGR